MTISSDAGFDGAPSLFQMEASGSWGVSQVGASHSGREEGGGGSVAGCGVAARMQAGVGVSSLKAEECFNCASGGHSHHVIAGWTLVLFGGLSDCVF